VTNDVASRPKLRIAVYAISKNEAQFAERFYASAAGADCVVVADTGSTDNTAEILRKCGAQVYDIAVRPWRFDVARNAALALVPADVDVCVSLDLDEVLQPGWREVIESSWQSDTTRLKYLFDCGNGTSFVRDVVHARHGYTWRHRCHELLYSDASINQVFSQTDAVLAQHMPDHSKSRGQYLDLLRAELLDNPSNMRALFYCARELSFRHDWAACIQTFERYLKHPDAWWTVERAYALRTLGKAHDALGQHDRALAYFRRACAEQPDVREVWLDLAQHAYQQLSWRECLFAAETALAITRPNQTHCADATSFGPQGYDLAALAAYNLHQFDLALACGAEAVRLHPLDERLQRNLAFYQKYGKISA
jgi:glycosyltransferase involved in cell wall biosynthesis